MLSQQEKIDEFECSVSPVLSPGRYLKAGRIFYCVLHEVSNPNTVRKQTTLSNGKLIRGGSATTSSNSTRFVASLSETQLSLKMSQSRLKAEVWHVSSLLKSL